MIYSGTAIEATELLKSRHLNCPHCHHPLMESIGNFHDNQDGDRVSPKGDHEAEGYCNNQRCYLREVSIRCRKP